MADSTYWCLWHTQGCRKYLHVESTIFSPINRRKNQKGSVCWTIQYKLALQRKQKVKILSLLLTQFSVCVYSVLSLSSLYVSQYFVMFKIRGTNNTLINFIKYAFFACGYIKKRPPFFTKPIEYAFDSIGEKCLVGHGSGSPCIGGVFIKCLWCTKSLCFKHFYDKYHYCEEYIAEWKSWNKNL